MFETVVRRCMAEGLVGGEGFAVDASLIEADANKQRSVPGHEWSVDDLPANATRAVKDYLARLDDAAFGAASEVTPCPPYWARCLARIAPATRLPAAFDPYFFPAFVAIFEKFLPSLPMCGPNDWSSRQNSVPPGLGWTFRQVSFWRSARQPTEAMSSALPFCPSLIQPTEAMNSAQWLRPKYRRYLTTEWLLI
jgi:hypothetical protein